MSSGETDIPIGFWWAAMGWFELARDKRLSEFAGRPRRAAQRSKTLHWIGYCFMHDQAGVLQALVGNPLLGASKWHLNMCEASRAVTWSLDPS